MLKSLLLLENELGSDGVLRASHTTEDLVATRTVATVAQVTPTLPVGLNLWLRLLLVLASNLGRGV